MSERNAAVLKAAICVAWADGVLKDSERRALEGILAAADLSPTEKSELRAYAERPRTVHDLSALDVSALSPAERRMALTHAVVMAFSDRDYEHMERQSVIALAQRLGLSTAEAHQIIATTTQRITGR
ncbi:MAG: TerB family tellurite resistance protein [Myxococcales bacterium]|jgi:tellurite resistance protein|nr:TerB family tellurite resistance protein [Myxococcales bacterium]